MVVYTIIATHVVLLNSDRLDNKITYGYSTSAICSECIEEINNHSINQSYKGCISMEI